MRGSEKNIDLKGFVLQAEIESGWDDMRKRNNIVEFVEFADDF